jgi:hypothetical protein
VVPCSSTLRSEHHQPWREDPVGLTLLTMPPGQTGLRRRPVATGVATVVGPLPGPPAPASAGKLRGGGPVALPGWSRRRWRRWVVGRLTGTDTILDTVLLDLDGTLYVGSQVVSGASEAVRWLRAQGLTVCFTTNTDSIPRPGSLTAWTGSASWPPRTSWSPRSRSPKVAAGSLVRPQLDCALRVVPSRAWHTTRALPIAYVS